MTGVQTCALPISVNENIVYRDIVNRLKGEGERSKEYDVNIDLSEYPNVDIAYIKDRAGIDNFFLLFGIDVNGDNLIDVVGYAGDYRTRIKEKFLSIPMAKIEIEKMGYGDVIRRFIPGKGDKRWYYNAFGSGFTVNLKQDSLVLNSDMKKARQFILVREFPYIDLTKYPYIGLEYLTDTPGQKLKMKFKVDTNGDRKPDREFETDFNTGKRTPSSDGFVHLSINTVKIAGVCPVSGGKDEGFDLMEVTIFFQGGGNFYLKDFHIYNKTIDIPFHVMSRLIPSQESDGPIFLPLETEEREFRGVDIMKVNIYDQLKGILEKFRKQLKDEKEEDSYYKDRLIKVVAMLGRDEKKMLFFGNTLKNTVKEITFYRNEDTEIPRFIAESMNKEEWKNKLESEGGWMGYDSKSDFLIKDYAINERLLWKEVKYNHLDLLTWEIKGENAFFSCTTENNFLKVSAFFSNKTQKRGRVIINNSLYKKGILNKTISPIDLKRFPTFDVSFQGYNPSIQRMSIILGLDFNGDMKEDSSVDFPIHDDEISGGIGKEIRIGREALRRVERLYPSRNFYYISDIRILLENRETEGEKVFYLKGIRFYPNENRESMAQIDERDYSNKSVSLEPIEMAFGEIYESTDTLKKVTGWEVGGEKVFYRLENDHGNLKLVFGTKYIKKQGYLALSKRFSDVDLEKYPFIRFDYILSENVDVQDPFIKVILDIKGERHAFCYTIQGDNFRNHPGGYNVYTELKKDFPLQKRFLLSGITIEIGKNFSYKGSEKVGLILKGFKVFSRRRGDMAEYLNSTGFRYQEIGWKEERKNIELISETIGTFYDKIISGIGVQAGGKSYFIKDFEKEEVEGIFNSSGMLFDFGKLNLKRGRHRLRFKGNEYFDINIGVLESVDPSIPVVSREEAVIQFEKINPTRYLVDVKAKDSFWLVFSESFHEGWRAYIRQKAKEKEPWSALLSAWRDRGERVEIKDHFMVNGYANGWMVTIPPYPPFNKGGKEEFSYEKAEREFQIVLEYKPQRLFEIGVIISLITLIGCIVYLGYDLRRRKVKGEKSKV